MSDKNKKNKRKQEELKAVFEAAGKNKKGGKYELNLYIAGYTRQSMKAIENIKRICEEQLNGRYELNIIDIFQQPMFAREGQIVAAPTLVKKLPLPLRRFIGDMSNTERILAGLDIRKQNGDEKKKKK